jgi:hypothetical protein
MNENELESRIFEDCLTGDPIKKVYEAKRNPLNNGTNIFNKSKKEYFDNTKLKQEDQGLLA